MGTENCPKWEPKIAQNGNRKLLKITAYFWPGTGPKNEALEAELHAVILFHVTEVM